MNATRYAAGSMRIGCDNFWPKGHPLRAPRSKQDISGEEALTYDEQTIRTNFKPDSQKACLIGLQALEKVREAELCALEHTGETEKYKQAFQALYETSSHKHMVERVIMDRLRKRD